MIKRVCNVLVGMISALLVGIILTMLALGYQVRFMELNIFDDLQILGPKALIPLALAVGALIACQFLDRPCTTIAGLRLKQLVGIKY